ncbi:hypothetical protein BDZ91DRAFT_349258 [Kalaharituber pfeilii]|nr:hypothetical protein BDZ91DRAFT_349258 [Kalaharituber pfeilii]
MPPVRKNRKANAGNLVIPGAGSRTVGKPTAYEQTQPVISSAETLAISKTTAARQPVVDPATITPPAPVAGGIEYVEVIAPMDEEEREEEWEAEQQRQGKDKDKGKGRGKKNEVEREKLKARTWEVSRQAERLVESLHEASQNRNPELHNMYIYNDFWGYGLVEIVENWLLDFAKAWGRYRAWRSGKVPPGNWKKSEPIEWAYNQGWSAVQEIFTLLEGFVMWSELTTVYEVLMMVDDGDMVIALLDVVAKAFLTVFDVLNEIHVAHFNKETNPHPLAPIKNLGLVAALVMKWASEVFEEHGDEDDYERLLALHRTLKRWGELDPDRVSPPLRRMLMKHCDARVSVVAPMRSICWRAGDPVPEIPKPDLENKWEEIGTWDLRCPWEGNDGYCSCCESSMDGSETLEGRKGKGKKRRVVNHGAAFESELRKYKRTHGHPSKPGIIGGTSYDITKLSRFERDKYEYGMSPEDD